MCIFMLKYLNINAHGNYLAIFVRCPDDSQSLGVAWALCPNCNPDEGQKLYFEKQGFL